MDKEELEDKINHLAYQNANILRDIQEKYNYTISDSVKFTNIQVIKQLEKEISELNILLEQNNNSLMHLKNLYQNLFLKEFVPILSQPFINITYSNKKYK